MAMSLTDICQWIRAAAPGGELVSDSRRVAPGDVFFAYPGEASDGRAYIAAAIAAGAAAVVYEENGYSWDAAHDVPRLGVTNLKKNAGPIAHAVLDKPDAGMFTVGVTGTNGKTSIAVWTGQALARLGETAAVVGTLGVGLVKGRASRSSTPPATPRRTRCCWPRPLPTCAPGKPLRWRSKSRPSAWCRSAPPACISTSPSSPT